jgi:hypothetical protein
MFQRLPALKAGKTHMSGPVLNGTLNKVGRDPHEV